MSRLVLLRHGESTANAGDMFAGWLDVPLTPRGLAQAEAVGRSLAALRPGAVHASVLGRAVSTACLMATAAGWDMPLCQDWRLNERHYGALQGLGKAEARVGTAPRMSRSGAGRSTSRLRRPPRSN
jgi:2,3-bisphosphoglycerate-dependent phosphoglycerate mutase